MLGICGGDDWAYGVRNELQAKESVKSALPARICAASRRGEYTIVRDQKGHQIAVPRGRELNRYTVRGMAEDAEVPWQEFQKEVS